MGEELGGGGRREKEKIESRTIRGKLQGRRSSMVEFDPWYLAVDETGNSEEFRESGAGHWTSESDAGRGQWHLPKNQSPLFGSGARSRMHICSSPGVACNASIYAVYIHVRIGVYTWAKLNEIWPDVYSEPWCRSAPYRPTSGAHLRAFVRERECLHTRSTSQLFADYARSRSVTGGIALPTRLKSACDQFLRLRHSRSFLSFSFFIFLLESGATFGTFTTKTRIRRSKIYAVIRLWIVNQKRLNFCAVIADYTRTCLSRVIPRFNFKSFATTIYPSLSLIISKEL